MPVSSSPTTQPPIMCRYRRCQSLPSRNPRQDAAAPIQDTHQQEKQVVRTRSCDLTGQEETCRFRIAYSDDTLRSTALANMTRLLRAAKQSDGSDANKNTKNNGVLLAKKALRYRNMLALAQAVDMDDPAFDITHFLKIKWHKVERKETRECP